MAIIQLPLIMHGRGLSNTARHGKEDKVDTILAIEREV